MLLLLKLKMKTICQRWWKNFQWFIMYHLDDVEDALMKTYMEARPTTNMKKGWLCRTSRDEKNWEIAPFARDSGSSDDDDDPVMIQLWWWSNFDDDPMMIQLWWWSNDDPALMMMIQWYSSVDDDPELIQRRILVLMNCVKRLPS